MRWRRKKGRKRKIRRNAKIEKKKKVFQNHDGNDNVNNPRRRTQDDDILAPDTDGRGALLDSLLGIFHLEQVTVGGEDRDRPIVARRHCRRRVGSRGKES